MVTRSRVALALRKAMKISCACGYQILDSTDYLPHKGHIIADQLWFDMFDEIDAVIEGCGSGKGDREAACMRVRESVLRRTRLAWQCSQCGILHLDDEDRVLQQFRPNGAATSRTVFARRRDAKKEPIRAK